MEIAILDAQSGSVSLHTLPQHLKDAQDWEVTDYIHLTLEIDNAKDYIIADKIILNDFRVKNIIPDKELEHLIDNK